MILQAPSVKTDQFVISAIKIPTEGKFSQFFW